MEQQEYVVLVNEKDQELGLMEKQQAHEAGVLHRAFSVFIFNTQGEMLLQQRAQTKYHSPGLWTNACCSHPREGETYEQGAHRRLKEEMGMDANLTEKFHFIYKEPVGKGLTEHELDYVFTGITNETPKINPNEVASYRYVTMDELQSEIIEHPEHFTEWFKIIWNEYVMHLEE